MKLIICEKPSVAKSVSSALGAKSRADGFYEGNGLLVSWCVGHLVSPMDAAGYDPGYKKWSYDDLPILPEPFRYVLAPGKEDAFENLRALMGRPDVDTVVNACDAGREGELIFRLVYEMAGCTKPILRLWISSMEDAAIREGFQNLRPGADYDALYQSALCRQKADWLVGINATRLFSILYHRTLNVGRVQTPTLAMLADRDWKITSFKKEKYHHVRLTVGGAEAVSEKISSPEDAQAVQAACVGNTAVCTSATREQKKEQPPKLYDLTTLQREANRMFGYTAKQTLDYAQSLYEKKLLTYPRTDSRYLTSDMAETATCIFHLAAKVPPFDGCAVFIPDVAALISDPDVSDHHAIIPTMEMEKADVGALPVGERNLFLLVCCRLLCAVAEPHVYETVTATFDCGGHSFTAKGKYVVSGGWREIDRIFRSFLKEKPADGDGGGSLPDFKEGQTFEVVEAAVTEHFTSPPKPYTEDTLLSAMENAGKEDIPDEAERKGLGTPATRAAIIEKLVAAGFVERKGKNLIPTKDGINLVTVLPEPLTSPMLTAEWEQKLTEVAKGSADPGGFLDGIRDMVRELVQTYSHISEEGQKLFAPEKEVIGTCPRCGRPVYEGKKNFSCSDRSCGFVLWKNDRFWTSRKKELTKKMAADLLKKGRTNVKGMWSEKKGSTYDAAVILNDTGGKYINFKLEFQKERLVAMADKTIPDFVFPPGGEKPDMNRDDLAAVAEAVAALSPEDQSLLAAVQASPYRLTTVEQFREFPDNIDFFVLEPQVKQVEDLGWRYLEQHLDLELSPTLKAAIDPVPFGRQAMEEDRGCFAKYGYLSLSGDEWQHEQAVEHGWREMEKKPSIRERLEQSKKECAGKDRAQPIRDKSAPEL